MRNLCKDLLFGLAVGDALGVPVEFTSRKQLQANPVKEMRGYGTYDVPPGTWSDDSSLTFCLAEVLAEGFSIKALGENFVRWKQEAYWTAHGHVFDIGIATRQAIDEIMKGTRTDVAGGFDEFSNGNGSLMRISPLVFFLLDKPTEERYAITKQISSVTHGHIRSVLSCFYYLEFARLIVGKKDKFDIYQTLKIEVSNFLRFLNINQKEVDQFARLLKSDIFELTEEGIASSGYVLHTLEASVWCLLTTDCYKDAVLKAVNLGEDTDTTGAITGALAGLLYGFEAIPNEWTSVLARKVEIADLANRLMSKYQPGLQ